MKFNDSTFLQDLFLATSAQIVFVCGCVVVIGSLGLLDNPLSIPLGIVCSTWTAIFLKQSFNF